MEVKKLPIFTDLGDSPAVGSGAGDGNRTRIRGLGSRYSTTEPRPPCKARVKTNRSILWPQALLFPDCSRTNSWIRVRAVLAAGAIKDAVPAPRMPQPRPANSGSMLTCAASYAGLQIQAGD